MANLAQERLQALLDIMREHDWAYFPFPGSNTQGYVHMLLVLTIGSPVSEKLPVALQGTAHKCWDNARTAQCQNPALEYWEGFIANADSAWPTPHAWNMLNGAVYDVTVDSTKYDYFGYNPDALERNQTCTKPR